MPSSAYFNVTVFVNLFVLSNEVGLMFTAFVVPSSNTIVLSAVTVFGVAPLE